ncbi:adenylate/guanylate cyclase domain-containing protein [Acuticoccus sp. M5D2P5]|uniref:adenylate/guanylate cyclase domain-containing protein n=1 Tax=Acuticoccus kalidii TaxID=2910977 RepID=UPI001F2D1022|nr:adenylate/guanylate cyclase domain-containing protein [Acuticoccus kalidii]MCF3934290.1 adenylate/guanylate cyclase domain-containing protein [Acuticoccus kalidii]
MLSRLIAELEEFLAISALEDRPFRSVFAELCRRTREGGVSLSRASIGWRLLDPVFFSQNIVWRAHADLEVERFEYSAEGRPDVYLRSPLRHVVENGIAFFRRRICDPDTPRDFEILSDLADAGISDYILMLIGFGRNAPANVPGAGVIFGAASDAPGGFTDDEIAFLKRVRYMIAVAARMQMLREAAEQLASTYLATSAGRRVLNGEIRRGDGEVVEGVIWYCDLRGSTALCERLGTERYIDLLNDYFSATAGPVAAAGGDVLDFIGDAVLAIFPHREDGVARAIRASEEVRLALGALLERRREELADRAEVADLVGIAIDVGRVMYGNIGIPNRLTFSVIGSTVNQVTRIERLTKELHVPLLVTAPIAAIEPARWTSRGTYALDGVSRPLELFSEAAPVPDSGFSGSQR